MARLLKITDISKNSLELQVTAVTEEIARQRVERWITRNIVRDEGEITEFTMVQSVSMAQPGEFRATIEL